MRAIDVPLQPKEREVFDLIDGDNLYTTIGMGGSRGGGKSHAARSCMLLRRLKYPGTGGLIFRRKWKQLFKNHLLEGYFKQYPFMQDWWVENKHLLHLPNKSWIFFGCASDKGDVDDFQGDEYMDTMIDEATQSPEGDIVKLQACRRWTKNGGVPDHLCKSLWTMNPGGVGHAFVQRIMLKREYKDQERPGDYQFVPVRAWDNVEWARQALELDGHGGDCQAQRCGRCASCVYYSWSDRQRFKYFIEQTAYGRTLNALPLSLRVGWLLGDWDKFAGQYFDCFFPDRHVVRCQPDRAWHSRWLGIDWGFQHPACCYWFARLPRRTSIYKEFEASGRSARALAQEIVDRTPLEDRKLIEAIYLSPDAFQKRDERDSYAQLMGEVFRACGMPEPTRADDDRVNGAALMYQLFKNNEVVIDPSCRRLIEVLPMITCDEEEDGQTIKFDGDDPYDAARYGLKSRERPGVPGVEEVVVTRVEDYAIQRHTTVEELDPNTVAQLSRRARFAEHRRRRSRRGGLGRIFRPQPAGGA